MDTQLNNRTEVIKYCFILGESPDTCPMFYQVKDNYQWQNFSDTSYTYSNVEPFSGLMGINKKWRPKIGTRMKTALADFIVTSLFRLKLFSKWSLFLRTLSHSRRWGQIQHRILVKFLDWLKYGKCKCSEIHTGCKSVREGFTFGSNLESAKNIFYFLSKTIFQDFLKK